MQKRVVVGFVVAGLSGMSGLSAQEATSLDPGSIGSAMAGAEPALFVYDATEAGLLTVAVRADADTDLTLAVSDDLGQPLAEGESDDDIGGDVGAEQITVTLPGPGTYQVRVGTFSGSGSFTIASGFIAFPAVAAPTDPDGRPTEATTLVPGTPVEDQLAPSDGDAWDWYKVTADAAGAVTVLTLAPEGDLVIEVFTEGAYARRTRGRTRTWTACPATSR